MLAKVKSYSILGINGYGVEIEVDINSGLPSYDTVGLPDTAVKEGKERIRSAIKNSGLQFPVKKITINLAPADTKKEGPSFDLPIAVSILVASEQIKTKMYKDYIILVELSLDGSVKSVNGILPIVIDAYKKGHQKFILPKDNVNEASYIEGAEVYGVTDLAETVKFLNGEIELIPAERRVFKNGEAINKYGVDLADVKGQAAAKRAIEIAVAGGHNVMMIGPPGAGKSMLAKCVPTIMPDMTFDEALEVTKIHSVAGLIDQTQGIVINRPFRSPHHTATKIALAGGGISCKPGEISYAHNGVLFLDEMPEYSRESLEILRQPLEDGVINVARAIGTIEYPAKFMLVASMNPCPCGNYGSRKRICSCTPAQIHKYLSKLSGPMMDRIDIHIEVDNLDYAQLADKASGESSATVKKRIEKAREIQRERFKGTKTDTNAHMTSAQINKYCHLDEECDKLLRMAYEKLNLSARASTRILKVARTIADIEGSENIGVNHISEAIQYRSLDRKYNV